MPISHIMWWSGAAINTRSEAGWLGKSVVTPNFNNITSATNTAMIP